MCSHAPHFRQLAALGVNVGCAPGHIPLPSARTCTPGPHHRARKRGTSGAVQGSSHPRPGRGAAVKGCWAPGPGPRTRFGLEEPSWYRTALGGWRQSARKTILPWRTPAVSASGATKRKPLSMSTWRPRSQIPPTCPTWGGLWGRKLEHYGVFQKPCLTTLVLLMT